MLNKCIRGFFSPLELKKQKKKITPDLRLGPAPHLFLDQNEAQRGNKFFFETGPPPYLRVWMTAPPLLSEGLDLPLFSLLF